MELYAMARARLVEAEAEMRAATASVRALKVEIRKLSLLADADRGTAGQRVRAMLAGGAWTCLSCQQIRVTRVERTTLGNLHKSGKVERRATLCTVPHKGNPRFEWRLPEGPR